MTATLNCEPDVTVEAETRTRAASPAAGPEVGARSGIGLALAADSARSDEWVTTDLDQLLVPNDHLRWYTVQEIPACRWRAAERAVRLGAVRRVELRYGMPCLGRAESTFEVDVASPWPADAPPVLGQLVAALADAAPGRVPHAQAPVPYLAFPADARPALFERVTRPGLQGRLYSEAFIEAFLADLALGLPLRAPDDGRVGASYLTTTPDGTPCSVLPIRTAEGPCEVVAPVGTHWRVSPRSRVRAGAVLGAVTDRTAGLADGGLGSRWRAANRVLGPARFEVATRAWFAQLAVTLVPGFVHLPAPVAAPAALGLAVDEHLWWDLMPAYPCYDQELDAFVFPPVPARRRDAFRGLSLGEVRLDLTPTSLRFREPGAGTGRSDQAAPRFHEAPGRARRERGAAQAAPAPPGVAAELLEPALLTTLEAIGEPSLPRYVRKQLLAATDPADPLAAARRVDVEAALERLHAHGLVVRHGARFALP